MTQLVFIKADGTRMPIEATDGESVMETAVGNDIEGIVAECGGALMCATCHVYTDPAFADQLPPRSESEEELLDCTATARRHSSRLSCQLVVTPQFDGMTIELPEEQ
ncbi:2Fe-2S iron-sulfur cluster-binding protein [Salinisphaera aquimarina]|uniref:2Fe-2S iron-sulfur cluster-binding protein n=1 Tax=Salinisphaera aquimarina TaxID=2094031 RepID=A0ABV7EQW0_9GAMM